MYFLWSKYSSYSIADCQSVMNCVLCSFNNDSKSVQWTRRAWALILTKIRSMYSMLHGKTFVQLEKTFWVSQSIFWKHVPAWKGWYRKRPEVQKKGASTESVINFIENSGPVDTCQLRLQWLVVEIERPFNKRSGDNWQMIGSWSLFVVQIIQDTVVTKQVGKAGMYM